MANGALSGTINPQQKAKLNDLVKESDHRIFFCHTVFPFKFFPDKIYVYENQVQLEYGLFFFSNMIQSFLIDDLVTVHYSQSYFFSAISFEVRGFETNPPPINYLHRRDGLMAHDVIMGLITAKRQDISLENMDRTTMIQDLIEIGSSPAG